MNAIHGPFMAAMLAAVLVLPAQAQQAPAHTAAAIAAGEMDPADIDVGAWRDERPEDLQALIDELAALAPPGSTGFHYGIFDLGQRANWALSVPDAAAYEASRARVDSYIGTVLEELERLDEIAADESHPRHGEWARYIRAMETARDPVVAELLRRTAREQFLRFAMGGIDPALTAADLPYVGQPISTLWLNEDLSNTQWLKPVVAERGWFTIGRDGEDASHAAWLLAQHASFDPDWQAEVLALMEPLAREGEVNPGNYAMLFDRIALLAGRPTRYGVQGFGCSPDGQHFRFAPVEDPDGLDARRAEMGIPPMAESVEAANLRCQEAWEARARG